MPPLVASQEALSASASNAEPVVFPKDHTTLKSLIERAHEAEGTRYLGEAVGTTRYLNKIGEVDLLSSEEEFALSRLIQAGIHAAKVLEATDISIRTRNKLLKTERSGDEAVYMLIRANLRLVISIAKKFPHTGSLTFEDYIQEGNSGLLHAATMYDWRKGFKFSTYATFWIRQRIGRAIDDTSILVDVPAHKVSAARAEDRECRVNGGILRPETEKLLALFNHASLSHTIGERSNGELIEIIIDDQETPEEIVTQDDTTSRRQDLAHTILRSIADETTRDIIAMRFGIETGVKMTYREIAEIQGIKTEKVRRLIIATVGKLLKNTTLAEAYRQLED